jgi:hypothetical protein
MKDVLDTLYLSQAEDGTIDQYRSFGDAIFFHNLNQTAFDMVQ